MKKKEEAKKLAIRYRQQGLSYQEIMDKVPVSQASLSLWLRDVKLTKTQKERLADRKSQGQLKGQRMRREQRIQITEKIKSAAAKEIGLVTKRELQLIGTALYWAEGSKQKAGNVSTGVIFVNSDPLMIKIALLWLYKCCGLSSDDLIFSIALHETAASRLKEIQKHWAKTAGLPESRFQRVYWKKNKLSTNRKHIGSNYFGLLRVRVVRSANLNRKIAGWIEGIHKYCGVV